MGSNRLSVCVHFFVGSEVSVWIYLMKRWGSVCVCVCDSTCRRNGESADGSMRDCSVFPFTSSTAPICRCIQPDNFLFFIYLCRLCCTTAHLLLSFLHFLFFLSLKHEVTEKCIHTSVPLRIGFSSLYYTKCPSTCMMWRACLRTVRTQMIWGCVDAALHQSILSSINPSIHACSYSFICQIQC